MANLLRNMSMKLKPHKDGKGTESDGTKSPRTATIPASSAASPRNSTAHEHVQTVVDNSSSVDRVAQPKHKTGSAKFSSPNASDNEFALKKKDRVKSIGTEIVNKFRLGDDHRGSNAPPINREGDEMSKNQLRKREKHIAEQHKKEWHERQSEDMVRRRREEDARAEREDSEAMRKRYGTFPINFYAGEWTHSERADLLSLKEEDVGREIQFRARLHNLRKLSAKLVFMVLRQQTATIQGVLQESESASQHMVRWAEHLPVESILLVKGVVQKPKAKEGEVLGTMIHKMEVFITELHVVSQLTEHLPFTVNEAETTEVEAAAEGSTRHHINDHVRLTSRILDLRTTTSQAIFRIQAGVCNLFRTHLDSLGFIEIHSPKLQGGATESGASVFKLDYFGRTAFLAQSPQLAKQMSIAADFGKVYEIGAVFRAENSNTHRHLTEYTGLDIEMAIEEHYHEALTAVDGTIKGIFKGMYERYRHEIDVIKRQFPHDDLLWLDETPVIAFKDAIKMLTESGYRDEHGEELSAFEDFGTRDEIQFGRLMKEKYNTDYYIVDKFPSSARPFYTMPDPEDPNYTNSFDIFVRGQEITSGGERVHDAQMLIEQMEKVKVDPKSMEEYMQGFAWAAPPHAGAGIGLERILMLMLQLGDIRHASMYPRDPRSLPAKPVAVQLRHPDASTLHPPWAGTDKVGAHRDLQPLEKLIANYGDASNTSWLEPRTVIWRDADTGAAVGYVPHQGFGVTVGDPLCDKAQYGKIVAQFLEFLKQETELKPLWLLCGSDTEEVLAEKFDWRTFSVAAEQRMDLSLPIRAEKDQAVARKVRHATKEGVKIHDVEQGTPVGKDVRDKVDKRVQDWLGARKGHQHVHLTDVHPWQDMEHRSYHYATAKDGTIACIVVLAQLSPAHGWQIKYSLDFPDSPSGAIEQCNIHALNYIKAKGAASCTFGGGATSDFTVGHNLKGAKVKMLSRAYHTVASELKLTQKSEFREKLGAEEDPIFVCYPPRGLGPKGVHAILSFFED